MKSKLLLFSILFFQLSAFATHNRGGEITFRQIGPLEVEASITTYTNANSIPADRDSLTISWGDSLFSRVLRTNGPDFDMDGVPDGEIIAPGVKMNIYRDTHLYAEINRYIISMTDPNRNSGIQNVNFPNSENVKFHIQSEIQLEEDFANNNSPVLLQPPLGIGIVGQPFMHVPNTFDIDDDSIAYSLITPLSEEGLQVPNYVFPDMISPGPDNLLTIDPETGVMLWQSPQKAGEYVLTIQITSYHNGEIADIVIRDFMIRVEEADQIAPLIVATENHPEIIQVAVGDTISVGVSTTSLNDTVTLSLIASCGLFEEYYENTASFVATVDGNEGEGQFEWIVNEEHLRQTPYLLVFRSQDNFLGEGIPWYHVLRYRVVSTVSIEEPAAANVSISAYPNPTSDYVIIETKDFSTSMLYYLRDTNGKIVDTGMLTNSAHQIDLSSLPPGMYLIDIPERKQVLKIIR